MEVQSREHFQFVVLGPGVMIGKWNSLRKKMLLKSGMTGSSTIVGGQVAMTTL